MGWRNVPMKNPSEPFLALLPIAQWPPMSIECERSQSLVDSPFARLLRGLPAAFRGKARIARWWFGSSRTSVSVRIPHASGVVLEVPSLHDSIGWHLLIDGVYEPAELSFMQRHMSSGGLFVDVGANIGGHALPLARSCPLARVLAIEASPAIADVLEKNIASNHLSERVELIRCAATDRDGEALFLDAAETEFGQGALSATGESGRSVVCRRLDGLIAEFSQVAPSLIKIDVEGHELEVLRGAQAILQSSAPPLILFEFHGDAEAHAGHQVGAAQAFLIGLGFLLYQLTPRTGLLRRLNQPMHVGFATLIAVHESEEPLGILGTAMRPTRGPPLTPGLSA